ncbi:MAG: hypothetical protein A2428_06880 [Bdellovibrionales bacterium RIFOXYC1_FULL_54_43]|nr:MAG: hypothetical protein A2428_06880 [Bdellovibrionales bacterium RIFOXYC1_FULL_54_43]OFZ84429.1 MAG: hypothetical protein A2603_03260 [Bdellovibrionales bacterium RIFOXYD1_FULL_55_31]
MRLNESHGRALKRVILIAGLATFIITLTTMAWRVKGLREERDGRDQFLAEEVAKEAGVLTQQLQNRIQEIRTQAESLRGQAVFPQNIILHLAELAPVPEASLQVVRTGRSTALSPYGELSPAMEDFYLRTIEKRFSEKRFGSGEISSKGVALLRVKKDPLHSKEWLALAFPSKEAAGTVLVALIDPERGFDVSARSNRTDGALIRSYVIAADGIVLAHSTRSYAGSDFASLDIGRDVGRVAANVDSALAPPVEGRLFVSVDQVKSWTALVRLDPLPLAVVVERVADPEMTIREVLRASGAITGFGIVIAIFLFWVVFGTGFRIVNWARGARLETPLEMPQVLEKKSDKEPVAPSRRDLLILEPMEPMPAGGVSASFGPETESAPSPSRAAGTDGAATDFAFGFERQPASDVIQSQGVERAFLEFRNADPELLLAQRKLQQAAENRTRESESLARNERILFSEFETQTAQIREPGEVANRLTSFAHRFFGRPALFFCYHPRTRIAVLQARAGVQESNRMAFPLIEDVVANLLFTDEFGASLALADYAPLGRLVAGSFGVSEYRAWPVFRTGAESGSGDSELMGIFILLGEIKPRMREPLARMMKVTGLAYEYAIVSQ